MIKKMKAKVCDRIDRYSELQKQLINGDETAAQVFY